MSIDLQPLTRQHVASFCRLVVALAEFEKLTSPDEAAQMRLVEDALGVKPRIEVWLAFAGDDPTPCGYMILVETYSSFLALPPCISKTCLCCRSGVKPVWVALC